MLIAVTQQDEVNMVACQVAYSLFNVRRRIARVRHQGYLEPIWERLFGADQLPIDVIISPELEVANGIARRLRTPGAFDTVSLAQGRVQLLGIHCNTGACAMVERRLNELPALLPGSSFVVVAVVRNGEAFVPRGEHRIEQGDDLYLITDAAEVERVTAFLGHQEQVARRVVIVGGGNVGLNLCQAACPERAVHLPQAYRAFPRAGRVSCA
jgi:trk system potassium uptake protein TrkA